MDFINFAPTTVIALGLDAARGGKGNRRGGDPFLWSLCKGIIVHRDCCGKGMCVSR